MSNPYFRLVILTFASVLLTACSSARTIERADQLATAGIAYTDAVPAVIDQSFEIAVTANSIILEQNRDQLSADQRLDGLLGFDEQFENRLTVLRDLKRHADLLQSYFIALRSLAQSDAATGITGVTTDLVGKLGALSSTIAAAQINGQPVSGLIGPAVNFAVGAYKNAAIKSEIKANGAAIERELALQQAALTALTEQMIADKDLEIQVTERNPVIEEYIGSGALSRNWTKRRISAYRRTVEIDSLKIAQKAAANLHQAWIALAENRLDEAGLLLLLQDIGQLTDLAQSFRGG